MSLWCSSFSFIKASRGLEDLHEASSQCVKLLMANINLIKWKLIFGSKYQETKWMSDFWHRNFNNYPDSVQLVMQEAIVLIVNVLWEVELVLEQLRAILPDSLPMKWEKDRRNISYLRFRWYNFMYWNSSGFMASVDEIVAGDYVCSKSVLSTESILEASFQAMAHYDDVYWK